MWEFSDIRGWHEKFDYKREVLSTERGEFRYSVRWAAKGFRLVTWREELAGSDLWVLDTAMAGLSALSARSWPIKVAVTRAPLYGVVIPKVIYKESGQPFETRLQRMNELLAMVENGDFDELPS